jgi:hypothetical protein
MFDQGASQLYDVSDLTPGISISSQFHLLTPHETMNANEQNVAIHLIRHIATTISKPAELGSVTRTQFQHNYP